MRLDRLDLTRYGHFTDRRLAFPAPTPGEADLHVVYGPNEAGKSTLFSAWLDLLFGIPLRTRYDFRHPGPTMRVGARLSHAGGALDLARVKRNTGSLLDAHDQPVPEALLQSALGGLTREGYSAMFSLDDDTLEKGGDSILASRGDLGEMLFSASAGLAQLSPRLETIRTALDGFHRSGKRSGWLWDTKKRLAELDAERRRLDVSAGTIHRLAREAEAAEAAWRAARGAEDAAQADLGRLQDLAATLPIRARLEGLRARLAPLAHLPEAGGAERDRLDRLDRETEALRARRADRARRLADLAEEADALPLDPAVLAAAGDIEAAEALRPEHETAQKDLPRREAEAFEARAEVTALLAELGHPGAKPEGLVLPATTLARLRALAAERSGLEATAAASEAERHAAAERLARERDRLGDPGPEGEEATLVALLARLRAQDPAEAHARARLDRNLHQARLTAALEALAPWQGDASALAALPVPSAALLDGWERGLEETRQRAADAQRTAEAIRADLDRLRHDAAAERGAASATGLTLTEAAAARSRREAAWARHRRSLDAASATEFEQALREDDRISALLAEALAEARRAAGAEAEEARLARALAEAEAARDAARTGQAQIRAALAEAGGALGLCDADLSGLRHWLALRDEAAARQAALREAEAHCTRQSEALDAASLALAAALGAPEGTPFETLLSTAIARTEAAERRREARRQLAGLAADLKAREAAEAQAQQALARWRESWHEASRGTILADGPSEGPVLDLLDALGAAARSLAALEDRIAKMEANRARFEAARTALLTRLGLDPDTGWEALRSRLRRAQDAARDAERLAQQRTTEDRQEAEDRRTLAALDEDRAALAQALGWSEADGPLAAHLACCLEAAELRRQVAALLSDLSGRPEPQETDDPATLTSRIEKLRTDLQLLRSEAESGLTAHLDARRRLEAVGGDDALARIASDRETLLVELRDRARAHLAARFGLMAFETGLRRYRDRHRSAMLARASDAFCRLSRGAYGGLTAQPDGAQEVLVALAAEGGAKLAADLSKGTRFQLYLALRIAGFHELAQSRPPVPFIADDIMETFDDDRSAEAFALLADMSRVGQVIYLTHHRHLCDIARAACPGASLIDLTAP
ncbi:AAA family ATPase [Cereibacter sphaeroides]|jgi:uncharacterized protein YhaN|uniref:AAA family ATPase n=1 Tax=Cereibacter sphaeroides TaxID=1063 RepID=UPI0000664EB3|nr:conserved hypothetical protein [Cereibacter sphaeroides ATCC 17029]